MRHSCADTDNPRNPFVWPPTAHAADRRAPYFGSAWTYASQPFGKSACVEQTEARYLVSLQLPPRGAVCRPDQQPFGLTAPAQASAQQAVSIAARSPLPGMPRFSPLG